MSSSPAYSRSDPGSGPRSDVWIAAGLFLVALSLYVLSGPGRIDMTDGQWRYEVTLGLLEEGRPVVRDPVLARTAIPGRHGLRYSPYGAPGSVLAMPLVWVGSLFDDPDGELRRFLFSHTSAVFAALLLVVLYRFYRALEVAPAPAVGWALAAGFATLIWPLATSSFDQVQHAFWILCGLYLAYLSARRDSLLMAAAGGGVAGVVMGYQEVYFVLLPTLALACRAEPDDPEQAAGRRRAQVFVAVAALGLVPVLLYNGWRFGDLLTSGRGSPGHPGAFGSPFAGLLGLLVSPGKGILFYSPPVVLSILGLSRLWRRRARLTQAVVALTVVHLLLISSLSFWAGEWSWGPRYLVLLLAPLALGFPYWAGGRLRRPLTAGLVGAGLLVQILALGVDHQRFFFERQLPPYFWAGNYRFYFEQSQLLARPGEIARSLRDGVPAQARQFQPSPYPDSLTYCIFGSREVFTDPDWVRRFQVFHLPRPWPMWLPRVDRQRYRLPLAPLPAAAILLAVGLAGLAAVRRGLGPRGEGRFR